MRKSVYFLVGLLALSGPLSAGRFELGLSAGFYGQKGASGLCFGASAAFTDLGIFSLEAALNSYPSGSQSEFGLFVLLGPKLKETRRLAAFFLIGPSLLSGSGSPEAPQCAVGGGLKWLASRGVILRLDARFYLTAFGEEEYPTIENLWRLTAGVSFRL